MLFIRLQIPHHLVVIFFQFRILVPHRVIVDLQVLHHLRQTDLRRSFIIAVASFDLTSQFLFVHEDVDALR